MPEQNPNSRYRRGSRQGAGYGASLRSATHGGEARSDVAEGQPNASRAAVHPAEGDAHAREAGASPADTYAYAREAVTRRA